jgi:hypothetical protein
MWIPKLRSASDTAFDFEIVANIYNNNLEGGNRKVIPTADLLTYFHPSIHPSIYGSTALVDLGRFAVS